MQKIRNLPVSPQAILVAMPIMNWKIDSLLQQGLFHITWLPTRTSAITYNQNKLKNHVILIHIWLDRLQRDNLWNISTHERKKQSMKLMTLENDWSWVKAFLKNESWVTYLHSFLIFYSKNILFSIYPVLLTKIIDNNLHTLHQMRQAKIFLGLQNKIWWI